MYQIQTCSRDMVKLSHTVTHLPSKSLNCVLIITFSSLLQFNNLLLVWHYSVSLLFTLYFCICVLCCLLCISVFLYSVVYSFVIIFYFIPLLAWAIMRTIKSYYWTGTSWLSSSVLRRWQKSCLTWLYPTWALRRRSTLGCVILVTLVNTESG